MIDVSYKSNWNNSKNRGMLYLRELFLTQLAWLYTWHTFPDDDQGRSKYV
jgi:hypothetical protein